MAEKTERHSDLSKTGSCYHPERGSTMGRGIVIGSQESGPSAEAKTLVTYAQWEREHGGEVITTREATGSRQKRRDMP